MNNRPICFIDHDETLMYSRSNVPGCKEFMFELPGIIAQRSHSILRPGAVEFLEALKAKGYSIQMLTQGWAEFQRACLKQYEIDHYFERIYGYNPDGSLNWEIEELPPQGKWLLVDNMDPNDFWRTNIKKNWMRMGDQFRQGINYLMADEYIGIDDVPPLTDLLPEIYRILG